MKVNWLSDGAGEGGWDLPAQFVRPARKVGLSVGSEGTLIRIKQERYKLTYEEWWVGRQNERGRLGCFSSLGTK